MNSFDEGENQFRISLQHFGFHWFYEPILVTARDILEEKFSREDFFARKQLLYLNYLIIVKIRDFLREDFEYKQCPLDHTLIGTLLRHFMVAAQTLLTTNCFSKRL